MFTLENTENFTQSELDTLNEVLNRLISEGWPEDAASDRINNAWIDGDNSVEALYARVTGTQMTGNKQ